MHPLFISLLDIIRIRGLCIFLPRSEVKHRFHIRNSPLVVKESRCRQPFTRKAFYWFLFTQRIDKRLSTIRPMADARTIDSPLIKLHVKFRPTTQMSLSTDTICIHTHINGGCHITILAGMHSTKRRNIH